jgi:hypothetical protein
MVATMTQTQRGKSVKHPVKSKPKSKAKPMVRQPQNHDAAKDYIQPPEPDHPDLQPPDKPDLQPPKPEPPVLKGGHEAVLHRIGYGPFNTAEAYRNLAREALEKNEK